MPYIARKPCPYPGCPNLVAQGYCQEHAHKSTARLYDQARRNDPMHLIYSSARWKKFRAIIMARDPVCKACNAQPSREADHIVPIRAGSEIWDVSNAQGLCHGCHVAKTSRETEMMKTKGLG